MTSVLAGVPAPLTGADLPAALLTLADAEADAFADVLHDGALQALVVARYAADAAVRGGDAALARDAVQEALVGLRRAVWMLRPRGSAGLEPALQDLAAQRAAAGLAPLVLDLDSAAAEAVTPVAAAFAYRLVQRTAGERPLAVRLRPDTNGALLALDAPPADARAQVARALAAGATLHARPDGTDVGLPLLCPRTEGPRTEGPRTEGPRTEGPRTEGPRTEGAP